MSDRLDELLRQRALLQEHLAWLDREIAEASGAAKTVPAPASTPKPVWPPASAPAPAMPIAPARPAYLASQAAQILSPASPEKLAADSSVITEADQIMEQYRVQPDSMKTDVKKGCFLYFFGALVVVGLGVVGLYFLFQRGK